VRVFQQVGTEHIRERMIFLVERKNGAIGSTYRYQLDAISGRRGMRLGNIRVSATSEHFFSPSASKKSSNLSYNQPLHSYADTPKQISLHHCFVAVPGVLRDAPRSEAQRGRWLTYLEHSSRLALGDCYRFSSCNAISSSPRSLPRGDLRYQLAVARIRVRKRLERLWFRFPLTLSRVSGIAVFLPVLL
jgi:hypothetical protein